MKPPPEPALPRCDRAADLDRLHGRKVLVEGLYEVEPVPGGKRLQAVTVTLSDGTALLRSYRFIPDELRFFEKRVRVVGTVYRDAGQPPEVQQVMAPHIYPDRVELAPGEAPHDPPLTALPPPPRVTRVDGLAARLDRWVQAIGVLKRLEPMPDESRWSNAVLALADDGTEVAIAMVPTSHYRGLTGQEVTVVGRAMVLIQYKETRYGLGGRTAVCPGRVERCQGSGL